MPDRPMVLRLRTCANCVVRDEREDELADAHEQRLEVELGVSDPSVLSSLYRWLREVPAIQVARVSGRPGVGEQGTADVLAAVASSSSLIAIVRMLPDFLRARRSDVKIVLRVAEREVTVSADNVADVSVIINALLKT
jgi:hypothetical protein